ncbi:MAG: alpha/beta fold hydrolase [Pseudomonadota bacterium]
MIRTLPTVVSILLSVCVASASASPLTEAPPRRGALGIGAQDADGAVEIAAVVEGGSAARMGVRKGDRLTKLNGVELQSVDDLLASLAALRAGEITTVTVEREGTEKVLTDTLAPRPLEQFVSGTVVPAGVSYQGGTLGASLTMPKKSDSPPVVYYIQGLACASMETSGNTDPNAGFFEDLLAAGYAVWRVEKPGMGDSVDTKHCRDVTYTEEAEAFRQGYKALLERDDIDRTKIVLFGHSLGGLIAPGLAAEFDPYGTVVFGTLFSSWAEYRVKLARYQPVMLGNRSAASSFANADALEDGMMEIFRGTPASQESRDALCAYYTCTDDGRIFGRNPAYWRTLEATDFVGAWSRVDTPVLSLAGESDIAIIDDLDQRLIPLMTAAPEKATFQTAKGINHFMAQVGSPEQVYAERKAGTHRAAQFRYRSPDPNFGPTVGAYTVEWIAGLDG